MEERKYVDINNLEAIYSPAEEAETTITTGRLDNMILIYSSDSTMITKLKRTAIKNPASWKCWEADRDCKGRVRGYFFEAPKKALSFRDGKSRQRTLTDEQREAASVRLSNMRARKRNRSMTK